MTGEPITVACGVFLTCRNEAEGVGGTPSLGPVPACQRCATKLGYPFTPGRFVSTDDDGRACEFVPSAPAPALFTAASYDHSPHLF